MIDVAPGEVIAAGQVVHLVAKVTVGAAGEYVDSHAGKCATRRNWQSCTTIGHYQRDPRNLVVGVRLLFHAAFRTISCFERARTAAFPVSWICAVRWWG